MVSGDAAAESYALKVANESYDWYQGRAIRCRRAFRASESLLLLATAFTPITALLINSAVPAALLGVLSVLLAGVRSIFHWQENYVRFSAAREAVEAERRKFYVRLAPYDKPGRNQKLVEVVTAIEQHEMQVWFSIATRRSRRPKSDGESDVEVKSDLAIDSD